jgi:hypothetical protein
MIGARLEAGDAVVDAAHGGEEQHRRPDARRAGGLDERQPVHGRQHAIDDQHLVVFFAGREVEAVAAVVGVVDHMAVLAQALGDVVGGLLVVFDQEDFHGARLSGADLRRNVPQLYKHSIRQPSGRHGRPPIFLSEAPKGGCS